MYLEKKYKSVAVVFLSSFFQYYNFITILCYIVKYRYILWNQQVGNKLLEIKKDTKPWNPPYELSRKDQVSITRIRIGHTNLTHCHLMKKENPPVCSRCACRITVKHILKECHIYIHLSEIPFARILISSPALKMIT
uniref:Uncharacterized protein n=1 Tax=Cacopsylla melanoneura TaxID=428564 RepID=A0A8D8W0E2_9HEMI